MTTDDYAAYLKSRSGSIYSSYCRGRLGQDPAAAASTEELCAHMLGAHEVDEPNVPGLDAVAAYVAALLLPAAPPSTGSYAPGSTDPGVGSYNAPAAKAESTPLQRLASLTALARALDALYTPADPQKLHDAAAAQGGRLPWLQIPKSASPAYGALRAALVEVADAAAKALPDLAGIIGRLEEATDGWGGHSPVALHQLAGILQRDLHHELDKMAKAPPADAAEPAKVGV